MAGRNQEFELRGVNHLALVCSDMARTVDFYTNVLGMPLIKTVELPFGGGQHFFFDIGNGDSLAFFWFARSRPPAPGVASPTGLPGEVDLTTAVGSMNHIAFDVPPERFDDYVARLKEKGVAVSGVLNHDDSPLGVTRDVHGGTFVRSVYFMDPDGILLEFACWLREFGEADVAHAPARAGERDSPSMAVADP